MLNKVPNKLPLFIGLALLAPPALAYIDPGTGTMLVQAILALFASALFYIDKFRAFLRELITKIFRNSK